METSRDDFVIAIRSAFLKKGTQQRFSLLGLIFFSIIFETILSAGKFSSIYNSTHLLDVASIIDQSTSSPRPAFLGAET